jgi:NADH:ubiquinone oxidoreductase subunit C
MKIFTGRRLNKQFMINLLQDIQEELPGLIYSVRTTPHGLLVRTTASKLRPLSFYFRNNNQLQFKTLVDIAVVDKILGQGRFAANYLFLSMITNQRLTLQLFLNETSVVPSLATPFANGQRLFASAAWLEREV